jgi:prepilin-type N-terminal cleavage/methylation domain-containing protein
MLQKLNSKRAGFTLVEIMIVVAIIALLAAIAVPNFLRARKRSQATSIVEELRIVDAAKDQYAIEKNTIGGVTLNGVDLAPYVKNGSRIYNTLLNASGTTYLDLLGKTVTLGKVDEVPKIHADTFNNFTDVILDKNAFWGSHAP